MAFAIAMVIAMDECQGSPRRKKAAPTVVANRSNKAI
jgi:hypothetical protein